MMDLCAICLERLNDPYGCTLDLLGSTCPTQQKWYRKHLLECAELEIQGTDAQASAPRYVAPNAHSENNAQIPTMKSRSTAAPGVWDVGVRASGCHRHWFAGTTRNVGQSGYVRLCQAEGSPWWNVEPSMANWGITSMPIDQHRTSEQRGLLLLQQVHLKGQSRNLTWTWDDSQWLLLNRQSSTLSIHPIGGSQGDLKSELKCLEV